MTDEPYRIDGITKYWGCLECEYEYESTSKKIKKRCPECGCTSFEEIDPHLGCFSYPNCDLSPTGCFYSGLSYDEMDHFGHK